MIVYQNFDDCLGHIETAELLSTWRRSAAVNTALAELANREQVLADLTARSQVSPPSLRNATAELYVQWGGTVAGAREAIDVVTRQLGDFRSAVIAAMRGQYAPIRNALAASVTNARESVFEQRDMLVRKYGSMDVVNSDFGGHEFDTMSDVAELDNRVAVLQSLAAFAQRYGIMVRPYRPGVQTAFSKKFPRLDNWTPALAARDIAIDGVDGQEAA